MSDGIRELPMSVIRPRPPTDPIVHHPPAAAAAEIDAWRAMVGACEEVRAEVLASGGDPALEMLVPYGTTRSHARRRDSLLFAILEVAHGLRGRVDRVIVIGDESDRAAVDLLLSTCCHPFHDALPRADRGGRPRMVTLGPGDDDDTVQGVLDLLAVRSGDTLGDAWGIVLTGAVESPAARRCAELFVAGNWPGACPPMGPAEIVIAAGRPRFARAIDATEWIAPTSSVAEGGGDPGARGHGGVFTAAGLLPAAVAGIDVVRLLEGAAAMQRRFREAPPDVNPVLGCAAVGPWLDGRDGGRGRPPQRRLEPEGSRWRGLRRWHDQLTRTLPDATAPIVTTFATAIGVAQRRRSPFGGIVGIGETGAGRGERPSPASPLDRIELPRCDEYSIGQLLELLRLSAEVERRLV